MKIKHLFILLLTFVLLTGCVNEKEVTVSTNDFEKIRVELVKKEAIKEGNLYTLKLINSSYFVIKQNNVFVTYPLKINENAYKGNGYKVEAKGNKLDIQPGEKITLIVFMPFEGLGDKNLFALDNPSYQLKGFLENVDSKHQFSVGGDLITN
ncbi:hypothetical protein ACFVRR_22470 [Gottfriedia sp. NPDC057948]|uniref:hypothetical protein n=1 Tax=Gottfriedia sp. NPDC057948 TaxID=3346287 RepID=UPI0036DAEE6B